MHPNAFLPLDMCVIVCMFKWIMNQSTALHHFPLGSVPLCWVAGMQGFYEVSLCGKDDAAPTVTPGHERHYYIAAEEQIWNYAPSGINQFTNERLDEKERWLYSQAVVLWSHNNSLYNYIHSHTLSKKQSRAQCTCMVNVSLSAVMLQNSSVKRRAGWAGATGKSGTLDTTMTRLPPRLSNMAQNIILAFWVNVNIIL